MRTAAKRVYGHDGRYWPLGMYGWTPDSGSWHFKQRVELPAALIPQRQPTPTAKTYTKSQLPYQIHPLHTHTHTHNTWYHELWIRWIRVDTNNSTKVLKDSSRPPSPTPQGPLVHSQQHLQMTGFETDWKRTGLGPLSIIYFSMRKIDVLPDPLQGF